MDKALKGPKKPRKKLRDRLVFPMLCDTPKQLVQVLEYTDRFFSKDRKPKINHAALYESILGKYLTVQEATILTHFCEGIVGNNIWLGDIPAVQKAIEMPKSSFYRVLLSLEESGHIKKQLTPDGKTDRVLVHPFFAFKGDDKKTSNALTDWYKKEDK